MKSLFAGVLTIVAAAALVTACSDEPAPVDREQALAMNDVWHAAKLRGVAFRAIGQEPGWLLEITNGEEILLVTDYGSNQSSMPYVEPVVYQEERRTQYVLNDYNTIVEIRGERAWPHETECTTPAFSHQRPARCKVPADGKL